MLLDRRCSSIAVVTDMTVCLLLRSPLPCASGQAGKFGSDLAIGVKSDFPAAVPNNFKVGQAGMFYHQEAKAYISHMAANTPLLLKGADLTDQLHAESFVKDSDGSLWVALYQRCVHLGCTVPFRDDCVSFKCPCHGSHYNVDGEFLEGDGFDHV